MRVERECNRDSDRWAMALSNEEIERAATKACRLGYERLKEEQLRVVSNVIRQKDVFAVLPTGYGKSLCFACLPLG